jgi:uncharacterized protein YodC (DUF2158 family)
VTQQWLNSNLLVVPRQQPYFSSITIASTKQVSSAAALVLVLGMSPLAALPARASSATTIVARSASTLLQGDLVRLHSGGPLMTIERIEGDKANCYWTDVNGQPNDGMFPISVLQKL